MQKRGRKILQRRWEWENSLFRGGDCKAFSWSFISQKYFSYRRNASCFSPRLYFRDGLNPETHLKGISNKWRNRPLVYLLMKLRRSDE